jgi:hypothetical protein
MTATPRRTEPSPNRRHAGLGLALIGAAVALAAMAAMPRAASAWGRLGHRAAARLSLERLTPAARQAVSELLEPGESLADVSTWADEVRRDRPESGPWHYVNVPITESHYSDRFCGAGGCVVSKIEEFRATLADRSAPRSQRRDALRFLVHFVQDMHQPVHVGDRQDRGGNDLQVQFFGNGSNLHRVWDSGLVERAYPDEPSLLRGLTEEASGDGAVGWAGGTVREWADESLAAARGAYHDPMADRDLRKGAKLSEAYLAANLPVARRRLAQAGVRLAAVLNQALDPPVGR